MRSFFATRLLVIVLIAFHAVSVESGGGASVAARERPPKKPRDGSPLPTAHRESAGIYAKRKLPPAFCNDTGTKRQLVSFTPQQALDTLIEGNVRSHERIMELRDYSPYDGKHASGQAPFAAIMTCIDSRIAPSIIFDMDRGNLLQVRLAGNVVDTQALGSLEYAVAVLKVPLIVVMAHTDCGAVNSAFRAFGEDPKDPNTTFPPQQYGAIVSVCRAIYPALAAVQEEERTVSKVTEANVALQVKRLTEAAPILSQAVAEGRLKIVGAEYMVSADPTIDGLVRFYDAV